MSDRPSSKFSYETAKADFDNALRKGLWRSIISWLTQSNNTLLPFDEVRRSIPVHNEHSIGVQQIEVKKIVGSVGRYHDFDRVFLPRHGRTRGRWMSIDQAHLQDVPLPPIEVYQIGEVYFVRDGNHRVSVAREKGQEFIDADVIKIETSVPIDENTDIDALISDQERIEFYQASRLRILRPTANIQFTIPGQYTKLLEHINVHRWFMGNEQQREVSWDEAVGDWYDQVYQPLVHLIHAQKLLEEFPGRSEADLYIWIMEHLWYLRQEIQQDISLEDAVAHFTEEYARNPGRRLLRLFEWIGRWLGEENSSGTGSV